MDLKDVKVSSSSKKFCLCSGLNHFSLPTVSKSNHYKLKSPFPTIPQSVHNVVPYANRLCLALAVFKITLITSHLLLPAMLTSWLSTSPCNPSSFWKKCKRRSCHMQCDSKSSCEYLTSHPHHSCKIEKWHSHRGKVECTSLCSCWFIKTLI